MKILSGGGNWRVPTKDEMNGLVGHVVGDKTFITNTVKVEYCQQEGVFGFMFTGVQPGYTKNSIFLPTVGTKHTIESGTGVYWTSYQNKENNECSAFSLSYQVDYIFYTTFFERAHANNEVYAVRPVLK